MELLNTMGWIDPSDAQLNTFDAYLTIHMLLDYVPYKIQIYFHCMNTFICIVFEGASTHVMLLSVLRALDYPYITPLATLFQCFYGRSSSRTESFLIC